MPDTIRDGSGASYLAKVNGNNRLYTNSVSTNETEQANKKGNAYNINSGFITLTDAVDTPLLYFKNNETEDYHITAIVLGLFSSTGGTGDSPYLTVIRNPTTGTIISGATVSDIDSNRNFGSTSTLASIAYKGATGDTMTNGTDHILALCKEDNRCFLAIDEVLPKGTSIGIKLKPRTSNTSLKVYAALIGHLEDINE